MRDIQTKFRKALKFGLVLIVLSIAAAALYFFLLAPDETEVVGELPPRPTLSHKPQSTRITETVDPVRITLVGDIMLDRYIRQVGTTKGFGYIFEKIKPLLAESDVVIGNLEGPVTTYDSLSIFTNEGDKNHYTFTFLPQALEALYESRIRILSIGNNHVLDFGTDGLIQTMAFLKKYHIEFFGNPRDEKQNVIIKEIRDRKIGFVSFNQFNPYNKQPTTKQIGDIATETDFIVVYAHWGEEYENDPNETQISLGRSFIDAGADFVIGAHPHLIQGKEKYENKMIYYSLGNFVFDQYFDETVRCGAVLSVTLPNENEQYDIEEKFIYLEKDGSTAISDCASAVPTISQIQE